MKKILILALMLATSISASAQVVRTTVQFGTIQARKDITCSFSVRLDTYIMDGAKRGELAFSIYNQKVMTGASFCYLPYEELPALIQTLKYAKDNPPVREADRFSRIFYRANNLIEFSCDSASKSKPEPYIQISPNTSTLGAEFPWTSLDDLISMLEKCFEILDAHCAEN